MVPRQLLCLMFAVPVFILSLGLAKGVVGFACNWGRVSSHPLDANIVVNLLKDNGFDKAKLFDADARALKALANSKIQVMVGIPNDDLKPFVNNTKAAEDWVAKNVTAYIKDGVDIRYIAISNEAFLKDYKDKYIYSVLPALQSFRSALKNAELDKQVKLTVPLNADIYESYTGVPSGGDFRWNVKSTVLPVIKFLNDNNYPLAINIYPFLSLYYDPNFPREYAFFNDSDPKTYVYDGNLTYTNAFDGNLDTLDAALKKNGYGSLSIIVGEVGWPTDGNETANFANAQRFYQGMVHRINQNKGTPKRPDAMPDVYMFGLLDEDAKSTLPGNFEPHWGIFNYDGTIKYQLDLGDGKKLVPAKGVEYMKKQWCVLSPNADIYDPKMKENWNIACGASTGCTSVANGSSCAWLDDRTKASYAFNAFYQVTNQAKDGCKFNGLTVITDQDPSPRNGSCKFNLQLSDSIDRAAVSPNFGPVRGPKSWAATMIQPNIMIMVILGFIYVILSFM
ncbi:hypothetical protein L6164_013813 [Bauhinia variegata]|uniref:Uncharacterized protein n=1 Tax=Bauhinia variegata TaxID=167791 RepID=A0ACB9NFE7_BAUVA|nr:hypothetical protein L6164_013813 [Bauhinia variegata]